MWAIQSDRVVVDGKERPATVIIEGESIKEILGQGQVDGQSIKLYDETGKVVMPGLVDTHVHINEPGRTEWEGFATATEAAAAGGITTLVDMPLNSSPVTTTVAAFEKKLLASQGKLVVDCGFFAGIVPSNKSEIAPLIQSGVMGFKSFLIDSGIDEFQYITEQDMGPAIHELSKSAVPWLFHAEMGKPVDVSSLDATDYMTYLQSRPKQLENHAIEMVARLSNEFNSRMHIVHLSSAEALPMIQEAKAKKALLTVETCHHYLNLCAEEIGNRATMFKCAPPIRERDNQQQLWAGLQNRTIDFIVSDHSPCEPALKQSQSGDFMAAWGGIAGLQYSLSIFLTAAAERGMTLEDAAYFLCQKPAEFVGLTKKGKLKEGFDADIVVLNTEKEFTVSQATTRHKHKDSAYNNKKLQGVIEKTFLRGCLIFSDGKLLKSSHGNQLLKN